MTIAEVAAPPNIAGFLADRNTTTGGQPAGTPTLTLPIRQPAVAVPLIELFLI